QSAELACNPLETGLLGGHSSTAKRAITVLAFNAIDNEIGNGKAFFDQKREISGGFFDAHRLRYGHQGECRDGGIIEHRPHSLQAEAEVSEEDIDFVFGPPASRKLGDDEAVLFGQSFQCANPM